MKTQTKTEMYKRIEAHALNIAVIFGIKITCGNGKNGFVVLSKSLFRLENKAHKIATDYCNGVITEVQAGEAETKILNALNKILGYREKNIPVCLNFDARGYALKIGSEYVKKHVLKIERDLGGYGLIAPDFRN
jgi:hypothetical protein